MGRSGHGSSHVHPPRRRHSALPRRPASSSAQPRHRPHHARHLPNSGGQTLAGIAFVAIVDCASSHHGGARHLLLRHPRLDRDGARARSHARSPPHRRLRDASGMGLRAALGSMAAGPQHTHLLLSFPLDLVRDGWAQSPLRSSFSCSGASPPAAQTPASAALPWPSSPSPSSSRSSPSSFSVRHPSSA